MPTEPISPATAFGLVCLPERLGGSQQGQQPGPEQRSDNAIPPSAVPRRACDAASVLMRRMLCLLAEDQRSAAYRPETEDSPKIGPPSRCGLSRDATTKSVRSLPQLA